jgi:hypothetical protein
MADGTEAHGTKLVGAPADEREVAGCRSRAPDPSILIDL